MSSQSDLKHLILCADDFGLAPGVNAAIINLINSKRINAVSCMTNLPFWKTDAPKLRKISERTQVGLHLTLTDHTPIKFMPKLAPKAQLPSFKILLKMAIMRQLDEEEILSELQRQFDAFFLEMGRFPDFIDGHHHIHQLPIIRNAVIELLNINNCSKKTWVRIGWEPPIRLIIRGVSVLRALSIAVFGLGLKDYADQNNIAYNTGFIGVYDPANYRLNSELFGRFLTNAVDGTLMFCHPGFVDQHLIERDPLTDPREEEYKFLKSNDFQKIMSKNSFTLSYKP